MDVAKGVKNREDLLAGQIDRIREYLDGPKREEMLPPSFSSSSS